MNIKLVLEYDGTDFSGFQRQPGLRTVQGVVEEALGRLAIRESPVYAAGRTDAGVHARGQVVNFLGQPRTPIQRLQPALNSLLPPDVAVKSVEEVDDAFNARRSARAREYIYHIDLGDYPSPFNWRFLYQYRGTLDTEAMSSALERIIGVHDFTSFIRLEKGKPPVREIFEAEIIRYDDRIGIRVMANAFAWMMMRMLSGSLLQVGRGRWTPERFEGVLEARDNSLSGPALPPRGLVLERVYY